MSPAQQTWLAVMVIEGALLAVTALGLIGIYWHALRVEEAAQNEATKTEDQDHE